MRRRGSIKVPPHLALPCASDKRYTAVEQRYFLWTKLIPIRPQLPAGPLFSHRARERTELSVVESPPISSRQLNDRPWLLLTERDKFHSGLNATPDKQRFQYVADRREEDHQFSTEDQLAPHSSIEVAGVWFAGGQIRSCLIYFVFLAIISLWLSLG